MSCAGGKDGTSGPDGSVPTTPRVPGTPGAVGIVAVSTAASPPPLPFRIPTHLLSRAVHDAELHMVNGRPDVAWQQLEWLQFVIAAGRAQYPAGVADTYEAKILSLGRLIAHGLDVFGRNFNYVPLTSFGQLADLLRDQLSYLVEAESGYVRLTDASASQGQRLTALREAASQLSNFLRVADAEATAKSLHAGVLQDEVKALFEELERVHKQLLRAESAFKNAVRRQDSCVTFGNVLKFAALVATVVATAGAAATTLAASATALESLRTMESQAATNMTWQAVKTDLNTISKHVGPAGKSAAEFATQFGKAQDAYTKLFPDRTSFAEELDRAEDTVRLVAAKADYDKAIKPYLGLWEAREYQAIMHKYIALAEARNNKILEHDRTVLDIAQMNARAVLERQTVAQLSATTAANFDTRLAENLAFLETSLSTLKWAAVRHMVAMEKSLEYLVGTPGQIAYSDVSVAALSATAASLIQRFGQALIAFGQDAQSAKGIPVALADVLGPADLEQFLEGKPVAFALNEIDDRVFGGSYAVQTRRLAFVSASATQIGGAFSVKIEHCGRSVVRQRDRSSRVFAHVPVTATYLQTVFNQVSAEGDLLDPSAGAGNSRYVGVSPYGPWRLQLDTADDTVRTALRSGYLMFDVWFHTLLIGSDVTP